MGKRDIWLGHVPATHYFVGKLRQGLASVPGDLSRRDRELINLGTPVDDILLDTACSRTIVHHDLVPDKKRLKCKTSYNFVVHSEKHIGQSVNRKHITAEAAVSDTLPIAVLLGTDIPELPQLLGSGLLGSKREEAADTLLVSTRGQKKRGGAEERKRERKDAESELSQVHCDC